MIIFQKLRCTLLWGYSCYWKKTKTRCAGKPWRGRGLGWVGMQAPWSHEISRGTQWVKGREKGANSGFLHWLAIHFSQTASHLAHLSAKHSHTRQKLLTNGDQEGIFHTWQNWPIDWVGFPPFLGGSTVG